MIDPVVAYCCPLLIKTTVKLWMVSFIKEINFALYYMYLHHTYVGTTVGVDTTIQKRKQYDKSRYQRLKEKKMADANANMEPHAMEAMTQNLVDFTRETNIGKIVFLPLCSYLRKLSHPRLIHF